MSLFLRLLSKIDLNINDKTAPAKIPISCNRMRLLMDHSVADLQLMPMLTGGSKYQAMPLGPSQELKMAPSRAPVLM